MSAAAISKDWYTAAELAGLGLPDVPATESGMIRFAQSNGWAGRGTVAGGALARRRSGRGGGLEYHYSLLPPRARARLVAAHLKAERAAAKTPAGTGAGERWAVFERLPEKKQAAARHRLGVIDAVLALRRAGQPKTLAVAAVVRRERAAGRKASVAGVYTWLGLIAGIERKDWLVFLAPQHCGGGEGAGR